MKKAVFILGLVLIFSGVTNAQKSKSVNIKDWNVPYFCEMYCGDVLYDTFDGFIDAHFVIHGDWEWLIGQVNNQTITGASGETYVVHEVDKLFKPDGYPFCTSHFNIIGENGNRFVGSNTWNFETGETVYIKAICPGNKK